MSWSLVLQTAWKVFFCNGVPFESRHLNPKPKTQNPFNFLVWAGTEGFPDSHATWGFGCSCTWALLALAYVVTKVILPVTQHIKAFEVVKPSAPKT